MQLWNLPNRLPLSFSLRAKRAFPVWFLLLNLLLAGTSVQAQRGFGFRFSTEFNHFFRSENYDLIDGSWSHIVIGPYYQSVFENGGAQIGLNFIHKGADGLGDMPVVQRDYNGDHSIRNTALEMDMKVGPRFGPINPKIGYLIGYRFIQDGYLEAGSTMEINRWYVSLPFGATAEFPTGYGSVGFGLFYDVGMTNVIKNPLPNSRGWNGSKVRSINIEMFVLVMAGKQKPKPKPKPTL